MSSSNTNGESTSRRSGRRDSISPASSRRKFIATAGAAGVAAFAGCGGDGSEGGNGGGGQGTTAGEPDGGTVELVWWHQENVPARIEVFEELNQRFMDEHDGIEVRQEAHTWGEIFATLTSAVDAGEEPDFWFTTPALAQRFHADGHLVDVSEMLDDLDSEYSYYDDAVATYEYEDGVWGIPNWNKGFNYVYRNDTFGDVDSFPPENWEDWLAGTSEVTDGDVNGFVLAATDNHFTYKALNNLMGMKDAYIFGPDGGIMFDTEEMVQVLDFYKQMFNSSVPDSATDWNWPDWDRSIQEGTVHSTSAYTAPFPNIDNIEEQDWQVMKNPAPGGGQWGDGESSRWVSIDGISVFSEDKLDAIREWITFAHSPETYGWWMRETNPTLFVPIHEAGWNSDAYWESPHDQEPFQTMVEEQHDISDMTYPGFRDIHRENDTYIGEALGVIEGGFPTGDVINELIVNDASPEEAASWGQSHLEDQTGLSASDEL